jgi:hypothetical protein
MDVRGLFIGGTYTRAQVEARWGRPTQYRSHMSEWGLNEIYDYIMCSNRQNNQFRFAENGIFVAFNIRSRYFPVYTTFSGGIRVNDHISRVQAIGLGTPIRQTNGAYHLNRNNSDDALVFQVTSMGVITEIWFTTSI